MRILVLGSIPEDIELIASSLEFVSSPKDADLVLLSDDLKSYFLGTRMGELVEEALSQEFKHGKPKVIYTSQLKAFISPFKEQQV